MLLLLLLYYLAPDISLHSSNFRAVKVDKKIQKYVKLISYFSLRQWTFNSERTKSLWQKISLDDQKIFPFTMENFDWNDYIKVCMSGIRIHLLKDTPDTIPEAKKRRTMYIFYYLNYLLEFPVYLYQLFSMCYRFLVIHTVLKYTMIMFGIWIFYKITTYFF